MGPEEMTEDQKGYFAGNFGAIKAFLPTSEQFPARILSHDKEETWIVNDESELAEIRDALEASCNGGKTPLRIVPNGA